MTLPPDRERVRQILSETIGLLCRNGLSFDSELSVDALIGVTIDHKDVFLISIKDTYDSEKNLQQPYEILSDCGQKNSSSRLDSALRCSFPSSLLTNDLSCAEKNLSFEKQATSNNFSSAQPCKRMIDRNEFLGDQTKRARISISTNVEASQVKPTLLAVVKSEPCDTLLAADTSGATSCAKSPNPNTSHHGQCTSGLVSLVNSKLNSVLDSVRLRFRVPSYSEDSAGKIPDVSCVAKESNSDDVPSNCFHQNKSNEVSSDCGDGVSSFDKQNISQAVSDYPKANSNNEKQSSLLPSSVHTQNFSSASRYNLEVPFVCRSSQSALEKRANSECSSDSLTLENASDQKSQRSIHRRKSNAVISDSHAESASSDSEVICIKEEIPYLPFNSSASFPADPHPSLQDSSARLKDVALTLSSVDSLNLESLSYGHSVGWKGMQNNFFHHVRRQQKDPWSTWNHDNVVPSSFTVCFWKNVISLFHFKIAL